MIIAKYVQIIVRMYPMMNAIAATTLPLGHLVRASKSEEATLNNASPTVIAKANVLNSNRLSSNAIGTRII